MHASHTSVIVSRVQAERVMAAGPTVRSYSAMLTDVRRNPGSYELWVFDTCLWVHQAICGTWLVLAVVDLLCPFGLMASSVDVVTAAGLLAGRTAAARTRDKLTALTLSKAAFVGFALVGTVFGSGSAYYLWQCVDTEVLLTNVLINVLFAVCLPLLCTTFALSKGFAVPMLLLYQGNVFVLIRQYEGLTDASNGMGLGVLSMGTITSLVIFLSVDWQMRTAHHAMLQGAKAQAEMASYVFHELRNALCAMQGVFDMLAEQQQGAEVADVGSQMLQEAHLQSHHAVQVVNNMLDYTKLRVGKLDIAFKTPFTVDALADEVMALVNPLARFKPEIKSQCLKPPNLPTLLGSPLHVKQVLLNLLTNAFKYTDCGSVRLLVEEVACTDKTTARASAGCDRTRQQDGGAPSWQHEHGGGSSVALRFAVADSGVGVPPHVESVMHVPFAAPSDGTRLGTGLGIPLCCNLVHLMGGELSCETSRDSGTTFSFTVTFPLAYECSVPPRAAAVSSPAAAAPSFATSEAMTAHMPVPERLPSQQQPASDEARAEVRCNADMPAGLHFLVVDDQKLNLKLLVRDIKIRLALPDARISTASSSTEALTLLRGSDTLVDVAFLDEHLERGGLTGTAITQLIREEEKQDRTRQVPPRPRLIIIVRCAFNQADSRLRPQSSHA
jgi:signal transduction histidine kinase/CheY-like chemotaxis protein